ncbi:MAG: DUF819 family protein [Prolixibacteraceae bacterium]|nr:DUF819 family protein [Prolixibacteraceae bacterium]MBN2773695.1 DUF819 family protein [Prolixibacteraceae bacterium]
MVTTLLLLLYFFLTPILLIYLCRKSKLINRIGAIVLAYALGLLLGNSGILPSGSDGYNSETVEGPLTKTEMLEFYDQGKITNEDFTVNQIKSLESNIMSATVLFAIPLLLFSIDFKRWMKFARGAVVSFVLAMVSLLVIIFAGFFIFRNLFGECEAVSAMLVGCYTGASYSLVAVGMAVNVTPDTLVLTNTFDIVIGAVAILFLMTIAQRTFGVILPSFNEKHKRIMKEDISLETHGMEDYSGMLTRKGIPDILKSLGVALVVVIIGGIAYFLVPKEYNMMVTILLISALGIAASYVGFIRKIKKSFQVGMYLIIVFSLVVASQGNLIAMMQHQNWYLFLYVFYVVFGSIFFHVGLSWIFKVDTDNTIIAITALTYSPPFVPVVAAALKNKNVIISGIAVGVVGYAISTFLGVGIFKILFLF